MCKNIVRVFDDMTEGYQNRWGKWWTRWNQLRINILDRPHKVYQHQQGRKIRGKHQIRRPISWQPDVVGCWNLAWFYITWFFNRAAYGPAKWAKHFWYHHIERSPDFVPISIEMNDNISFQYESHIVSFNCDCEDSDGISCDNDIPKIRVAECG